MPAATACSRFDRDYDIRGQLTLRQRLGGGIGARADQFSARARSADARAMRIAGGGGARRLDRLDRPAGARGAARRRWKPPISPSRRSRDVLAARFQASRGTLFDVSAAENTFFDSATAYIQGLTELDAARYVLLSRTGRLLDDSRHRRPTDWGGAIERRRQLIHVPKPRLAEWLIEPMRRNRATYWKVALAAVFINIFGLLTSLFTMTVYDRVVPNNATSSLVALSIGLAIVVIFDFILKLLRAYFVDHAGARIDRDIGEAVFERLLAMRLELKRGSTGALAGMMRELEALRDFFASATLTAIVDVPFILLTLLLVAIIGG